MTRVALYTHSVSQQHGRPSLDGPPIQHPEQPDRIASILSALEDPEFDRLVRMTAPLADVDLVKKYHDPAYVDRAIAPVPEGQVEAMDADTNKTIASAAAALRAVGAACDAIHQVVSGTVDRAFVAMRPPGHHAERARSMGFCLFGTVAIAAEEALLQHDINRVAIVDFDVHHGNGTQDLLWNQPDVLTITSQQMPLWPGTGDRSETGAHGQIMNLPLPTGSDGEFMRQVYETEVFPAIEAFQPDLLLISAGFDAHADDPLAGLNWSTEDYVWLTERLVGLAESLCQGRVVSCLEGGYDLSALATATAAHVRCLMREGND